MPTSSSEATFARATRASTVAAIDARAIGRTTAAHVRDIQPEHVLAIAAALLVRHGFEFDAEQPPREVAAIRRGHHLERDGDVQRFGAARQPEPDLRSGTLAAQLCVVVDRVADGVPVDLADLVSGHDPRLRRRSVGLDAEHAGLFADNVEPERNALMAFDVEHPGQQLP